MALDINNARALAQQYADQWGVEMAVVKQPSGSYLFVRACELKPGSEAELFFPEQPKNTDHQAIEEKKSGFWSSIFNIFK